MLLYIHTSEGRDREVRPLHTIPDTVNQLFYLAMREHIRPGVAQHLKQDEWTYTPDWRFDRQVIQVALVLKERLGVSEGDAVAVLGPLRMLWVQTDFAVQGLRGVPVGLHRSLTDEQIIQAVNETGARVALCTDQASADRMTNLRVATDSLDYVVVPTGTADGEDHIVGLDFLWSRGEVLDTPERAANWRFYAREAQPHDVAGIQYTPGPDGNPVREEFTHREAIDFVRDRTARYPAMQDDIGYFQTDDVTAATRMASYTFVGDGYTVITFPLGRGTEGLPVLQPAKIVASTGWLERLDAELAAISGLARQRKRRQVLEARIGPSVRWIEPAAALRPETESRLRDAGLPLAGFERIGA